MLSKTLPYLRRNTKVLRTFGKKMSEIYDPEDIVEDQDFVPELGPDPQTHNYNREEYPHYDRTIQMAQE